MTVGEIKQKKEQLEKDILQLIEDFENEAEVNAKVSINSLGNEHIVRIRISI